jgi:phage terminase small subunit
VGHTHLEEAKEEAKRNPQTQQEEDAEERRLLTLGATQAEKLGINPQDADRLVHDYRKTAKRTA